MAVSAQKFLGGKAPLMVQSPTPVTIAPLQKQNVLGDTMDSGIRKGVDSFNKGFSDGVAALKQMPGKILGTVVGNVKESVETLKKSQRGEINPFSAGANIAKNISGAVASPLMEVAAPVMDKTLTPFVEKLASQLDPTKADELLKAVDAHPTFAGTIKDLFESGMNVLAVQGVVDQMMKKSPTKTTPKGPDGGGPSGKGPDDGAPPGSETSSVTTPKTASPKTPVIVPPKIGVKANPVVESVSDIVGKTQDYLSRKNVPENFGTSVDRVQAKGDALKTYDEFYKQEQKFKNDIKQDTAIGQVGGRIGDSFDAVVKQRREVGAKMGEELKKVGHIKTNLTDSFSKFEHELLENGLIYDAKKGVQASRTSKVTGQDRTLLNQYTRELNKLGDNPTVAEIDAFLSRIPNEIDVYKGKNNVTSTTNGERIIKQHLNSLKETLNPGRNPALKEYYKARNDYHTLSNFLDEGSTFLGKKTQSGDYAKDASLSKSAVQSILNQGKKDWLLKLEELTGYAAMDESVLALQAMKDSGNFRGNSLLEMLTSPTGMSIPTSPRNIAIKIAVEGIEYGIKKLAGTPNEQTRRVIQER